MLTISGADTTAAQTQLDSFIERWKTEHVEHADPRRRRRRRRSSSSRRSKAAIPDMQLDRRHAPTCSAAARTSRRRTSTPNPYDGIITAEGRIGARALARPPHYTYCKTIYEKQTGITIPLPNVVVKLPNGKQNDIYGNAEDACSFVTMFSDDRRAGRQEPEQRELDRDGRTTSARSTVMNTDYASLHAGKYDADDTYGLVAVRPDDPAQRRLAPRHPDRERQRLVDVSALGVAALDGAVVGAEVRRRRRAGRCARRRGALGDHRARLEAVDAVADRQDQREVVLDDHERGVELLLDAHDQRAERLGLALRDAGGRLVEADARGARPRAPTRARRCGGCRSRARR